MVRVLQTCTSQRRRRSLPEEGVVSPSGLSNMKKTANPVHKMHKAVMVKWTIVPKVCTMCGIVIHNTNLSSKTNELGHLSSKNK